MRNRRRGFACVFALALCALSVETRARAGSVALSFTGGSGQHFPGYTVGWAFTATETLSVNSLGWFDDGSDGFLGDHSVGLYTGTGNLLASAVVTTSDPLDGGFRFADITLLTLAPGDYVVAGTTGDDVFQAFATGVTTAPGITFDAGRFVNTGNNTLAFPTQPSDRGLAYFGANFTVTSVPEPASVMLLTIGTASVFLYRRHRPKSKRTRLHP